MSRAWLELKVLYITVENSNICALTKILAYIQVIVFGNLIMVKDQNVCKYRLSRDQHFSLHLHVQRYADTMMSANWHFANSKMK